MKQRWKYVCTGLTAAAIVLAGSRAQAQGAPGRPLEGTVRIGFGNLRPTPKTFDMRATFSDPPDSDTVISKYNVKGGTLTDISGGVVMRKSGVGFGVAFSRAASEGDADFTLRLDHPFFHPPLTDTISKDNLKRIESGVHLYVSYALPLPGRLGITFFGGPSRLSLTQDLPDDLSFDEIFTGTSFRALLEDVNLDDEKASAWGFNAGADVSYAITPMFSVGVLLRHTRATVKIANELQSLIDDEDVTSELKVGGLQVSAGLRLRF